MKKVYFCVINNISFDQRMQRICGSLQAAGYSVTLVGRNSRPSPPLPDAGYQQVRLPSFFQKGKLMYLEFNIRLFLFLLLKKIECIVAIDLDTIVPCYYISRLKNIPRVYDAHEWFSELKEVVTRPGIHRIWHWIEKKYLPKFRNGYTVSLSIANAFRQHYGVDYEVIMNVPLPARAKPENGQGKYLLYQGAVNEGRCLEWLIPAMKNVNAQLWICGEGNFSDQCRLLIQKYGLRSKVIMKGYIPPDQLSGITSAAFAGINLVEPVGMNQVYSLANKFFDYIQAGVPQLTMKFPEYKRINQQFEVALLIEKPGIEIISAQLNNLLENEVLYSSLKRNCARAAQELNWHKEEKKLIGFYMKILG